MKIPLNSTIYLRPYRSKFRSKNHPSSLFWLGLAIASLNVIFIYPTLPNAKAWAETEGTSQQAESFYQKGQFREAIALWLQILEQVTSPPTKAALHSNLGIAYRQVGQMSEAIAQWQQAIKIYQTIYQASNDPSDRAKLTQVTIDQAQVYTAIGQHRQAIDLLRSVTTLLAQSAKSPEYQQLAIATQGAFGNAYLAAGDYDRALTFYQEGMNLASTLTENSKSLALGWLNVGNTLAKRAERYNIQIQSATDEGERIEVARLKELRDRDLAEARSAYDRGLNQKLQHPDPLFRVKVLLNLAHLLRDTKNEEFASYQQEAAAMLAAIPPSRDKVQALIDLASLSPPLNPKTPSTQEMAALENAIATAQIIGDRRSESFALGSLGRIYELRGELAQALTFTDRAQWIAQQINAGDSLYRWQWQAGRIYKAQGKHQDAMVAYRQAIASLQSIRSDLIDADRSFQFDVRDEVEPVYRELMELLLATPESPTRNRQIEEALQVSELLRLSELQNFFGDECLEIQAVRQVEQIFGQQKAAFVYSIILERQTYMVLRLPDGTLKTYQIERSQEQLVKKIKSFRFALENIATDEYPLPSQEIYNLLIRPMEADLARSQIDLLVFINDGALRSIPMAALHDGKQFLIQKYPIVSLLGTNLSSASTDSPQLRLISFGLSEAISPFTALPSVPAELQEINNLIGGEKFLNRDFTFETLERKIKEGFTVVHIASHAKFGTTQNATFVQAFDRQISLEQLETLLRSSASSIELLVLSACQTAEGDNRATLGLAGMALRSGVKSVLAPLWAVNDEDVVPLMADFYRELRKPGVTKAVALQRAQIKSITSYSGHPAIWSPFILVGN
ncbi:CHAT domain-containing protein [Tumidithrix elongata RA019]|uniref:CHAT domain-containing protein n=1 Tax=Tumidithrix elongata BACA0141 TaxID=2716417 RepID=A0AAW9PRK3_9CYAN|nr:CHAT domain-containing protein [Tumidithrix elongata RA019]